MLRMFLLTAVVGLITSNMVASVKVEKTDYKGWPNSYRVSNGEIELIVTSEVGPRIIRFGFCIEMEVEEFLVHISERSLQRDPGVRKNHIQFSTVPLNYFIQSLEIGHVGDVPGDSSRRFADFSYDFFQHVLPTTCDENVIHTFEYKALRGGKPHPS
jgi:hypothetical protein